MKLEREGSVYILDLGDGENRLNADFVAEFSEALKEADAASEPRALVTHASGKFYSNGFDLDWMNSNPDQREDFMTSTHALFAQVLESGVPTVAAIGGHAFGAGAMLALAHDQRVMREDRGFFCFPEVLIKIPFTAGMNALITAKLSAPTAHRAMTTGQRYGGPDAVVAQIVDEAVSGEQLLARAVERATGLAGGDPSTLHTIKSRLYAPALAVLRPS
jgi:enoyl-CoA hydratase/carnithine racemase